MEKEMEKDGYCFMIYDFLWMKKSDEYLNWNKELKINIGDTIVYQDGFPIKWYFTGENGEILKHRKDKLNFDYIFSYFIKFNHNSDIIATYYFKDEKSNESSIIYLTREEFSNIIQFFSIFS